MEYKILFVSDVKEKKIFINLKNLFLLLLILIEIKTFLQAPQRTPRPIRFSGARGPGWGWAS